MIMKYLFYLLVVISTSSYAQQSGPFSQVNSPYDEQNPVVSPDGKTLFITIAKHPQNIGGKRDLGDIWISVKEGDGWSVPVHGGGIINNSSFNSVAGISKDGNELYLTSHYKANGSSPSTQGISVSHRTNIGWSVPQNITIPYFLNKSETLDGFWHEGKSVFIFAAESYKTQGAEDLYISFQREGKWSELINLGTVINTPLQDVSPSLNADGTKLYFASNGRSGGMGSFDIYVSNRLDDTWTSWSEPVNLSTQINSDGRELYFREFPSQGFSLYTSTRNSDGYGDVRMIKDSINTRKPEEVKPVVVAAPIVDANSVVITGKVTNSKNGAGIPARLIFRADSARTALGSAEGIYSIVLKRAKVYAIEIEAQGFVSLSERLDMQSMTMNTTEMNFQLQPIEVGTVVNLKSVLFELGTTDLVEESYSELNVVVDFLKTNPKVEIELEGHTDNRGDMNKNLVLSQQRVDKIKSYLVSKGIGAKRISGKGYGGSRPIATSNTEEARKLNRRVEFRIVKY
jgi:outer membrane protein OmpA-like peptidoglycan-associated protein